MNRGRFFKLLSFYLMVIGIFLTGTFLGNRAVTVISEGAPIIRPHHIVIDPGHGGEDGGATSCTGKMESGYNLDISLKLRDVLRLLGYDVIMTRTSDTSIYTSGSTIAQRKSSDIKERVRIANTHNGSVLLSVHQNYFQESKYYGAQVFYSTTYGSKELAGMIQDNLVKSLTPESNRKEKRGEGIYILEHVKCPAVLIECGFISNPTEESQLAHSDYQKKIAVVAATTAATFLAGT